MEINSMLFGRKHFHKKLKQTVKIRSIDDIEVFNWTSFAVSIY